MNTLLLITLILAAIAAVAALGALWLGAQSRSGYAALRGQLREEAQETRRTAVEQARGQRDELGVQLQRFGQSVEQRLGGFSGELRAHTERQVASQGQYLEDARKARTELAQQFQRFSDAQLAQQAQLRTGLEERLKAFAAELGNQAGRQTEAQRQALEEARKGRGEQGEALQRFGTSQEQALARLVERQAQQAELLRTQLDAALKTLRQENTEKLEQMRRTVDEKLNETLERRLGESFKQVGGQLERVYKGLGEMQALASGVGDLKRVLTNVKTRGTWAELELGTLLDDLLTPEQFGTQVSVKLGSSERVDFAVRLPGRSDDSAPVWLPIDSKFPKEDYERLQDAQERADVDAVKSCGEQLERAVRAQAKSIGEKYIQPPSTTDFAILFLPTEGLFAEVVRRPGLVDGLQREHRVIIAGPTTLASLLKSLQMGFRTLAIEKRSSEVWKVLGGVKTEFAKFGDVLGKVQKKLQEASDTIDQTGKRTRAIERKLRDVEALPLQVEVEGEPEAPMTTVQTQDAADFGTR